MYVTFIFYVVLFWSLIFALRAFSDATGLFTITIRQALFIAPCSHTFHYKCIRPLIESHFPGFSCPLCRTFADLEEDVEVDVDMDQLESEDRGDLATPDGDGDGAAAGTGAAVGTGVEEEEEEEDNDYDSVVEAVSTALAATSHQQPRPTHFERDIGAETDVEPPAGTGNNLGRPRRNGHGRNLSSQMDPMELIQDQDEAEVEAEADEDMDMADVVELEHDAEGMGMEDFDDVVEFIEADGDGDGPEVGQGQDFVQRGPAGSKRNR